jgi:hypothetical protein
VRRSPIRTLLSPIPALSVVYAVSLSDASFVQSCMLSLSQVCHASFSRVMLRLAVSIVGEIYDFARPKSAECSSRPVHDFVVVLTLTLQIDLDVAGKRLLCL